MQVGKYILDNNQMDAVKSKSNATLVVAGAGSGKTLTIMGKIKYEIEHNKLTSDEILCISFTNESVNSLKTKLLDIGYDIEVLTFHKLGLKLLKNENYKIVSDNYLSYIIDEYFKSYISNNKKKARYFKNILFTDKPLNIIFNSYEYNMLKKTISTFIKLFKSSDMDINDLKRFYNRTYFNERELIKIILQIYLIYKNELESSKQLDFDDMISLSKNYVKDANLKYKYIIIDEFQDTSMVRFNLIKEIIKYTNAKLFVVGDDYQSIYRFSGCNLDLFINFKKYFKNSKYYYINKTYRNSTELIKVTNSFIMKNKKQLRKSISSNKSLDKPIKICIKKEINEIIDLIPEKEDLLILGRNNKDIDNINFDNKLTIHKSKGLEADNVILVNSASIPSRMSNEKILRFVLKEKDYIIFEEERRLFYVALTRTKNYIYIQVNKKISPFVRELINDYKEYIEIIN